MNPAAGEPPALPLDPGTRLGSYEILQPLGAGGMGEVYRARDTRLKREVALKTLPEAWLRDPGFVARLEREAQAASALNHPHIVTIHELGSSPPWSFIVMELVEGVSLRGLLARGPLPVDQLLSLGAQVADALAAAHQKGIVHRDLKPENVLVGADGRAKVLDFGLARIEPGSPSGGDNVETEASPLTGAGVVVGTVAYMSPEQAQGATVDYRSDQFSLGVLLYEMAAGRRPFEGSTVAETVAAILRAAPAPIAAAPLPPPLVWLIERCLAKQPGERYASTRELANELLGLLGQLAPPPSAREAAGFTPLPSPRASFVGREAELETLRTLLAGPEPRLLTLTGPGGTGKTRLALRAADEARARFGGGVAFVALAGIHDPASVVPEIALALGQSLGAGAQGALALGQILGRALKAPTLLVLDSFERVLEAAPDLTTLISLAPQLKLLVTSQAGLRLYGEREVAVSPLAVADPERLPPLAELEALPAIALFVERAAGAQPGFALTPDNAAAVAAVCARLDGLPLAIELAAARVRLLSPAALASRLARSLDFLTGPRDLPARQQTLRATLDWSHELLAPPEQALFRRLAVFGGGVTLEAAEAVADARQDLGTDVLEAMSSLLDKSLLRCRDATVEDPRFEMLEIVREYAREKLAASGDEELARRAHAAYMLVLAEEGAQACAGVDAAETAAALARFDLEQRNLRAALDYLLSVRQAELATRLAAALVPYWRRRERPAEGRERMTTVLALAGASPRTRAAALYAAGLLIGGQGDGAAGRPLAEECVALYRSLGDERAVLIALNALAVSCQQMGDLKAARTHLEQAIEGARRLDDPDSLARGLNNLASLAHADGAPQEAVRLYRQSRELFEARGDRLGVAWALDQEGDAARDAGEREAARALYEQSLAALRELGNRGGETTVLTDLARLARGEGDLAAARSRCDEALALGEPGTDRAAARLIEELATLAAGEGRARRALVLVAAAAALRMRLGWPVPAVERQGSERQVEELRAALGATAPEAWSQGWRMEAAEALAFARAPD